MAVQIPEERLAGRAGPRAVLRAPKGPYLRIVPLDAFALREVGLEDRENLEACAAVIVALVCIERPKIAAALISAGSGIFLNGVGIKEEEDAHAGAVERIAVETFVEVCGPEVEIALLCCVGCGVSAWAASLAEEWEKASGALAVAAGDDHERPGHVRFVISPFAIIDRAEKWPEDSR